MEQTINNKRHGGLMLKFKRIFSAFAILLLLMVGIAFAADGASKGNIWQTIAGFMALITTGTGSVLWSKLKLIKELKEAIASLVQLFGSIQVLAKKLPNEVKSNPIISDFLRSADNAAEETADVLDYFKTTRKLAVWLRALITAAMYTNSAQRIEEIKNEIELDSDISDTFKEAMAKLK